jgi:phycobilisome rod-core linker protein
MTNIPLLNYPLSSQNQRVRGFEIASEEQPRVYSLYNLPHGCEMDEIIWAAYRQIFNEQQILVKHRQTTLESQLRNGQITVRDFIKNLVLSDSFRHLNYDTNNNYRFVEMCIQRVLGRNVYDQKEKFAWSSILASEGLIKFVDGLLNSEEYTSNFSDTTVPYQRRRVLPQQAIGELPFTRMARYDTYYLNRLIRSGQLRPVVIKAIDNSSSAYRQALFILSIISVAMLLLTIILTVSPA